MQTKENLRTGSLMQLDDAVKPIYPENRDDDGTVWCMAIPQPGMRPYPGFTVNVGSNKKFKVLTYVHLSREEFSSFKTDCLSKRCTLVQLPPGVGPKDLMINGK